MTVERGKRGKAGFLRNIQYGEGGGAQQMLCHGKTYVDDVLLGTHSHIFTKQASESAGAQSALFGQTGHSQHAAVFMSDDVQYSGNFVGHGMAVECLMISFMALCHCQEGSKQCAKLILPVGSVFIQFAKHQIKQKSHIIV